MRTDYIAQKILLSAQWWPQLCPSYRLVVASPLSLDVGYLFLGRFQHPPIDGCPTASCDFGVLEGADELISFYSAILISLLKKKKGYMYSATAKSLQSCPTLCDPIDGSPPGSPVPGTLQARTLEWVTISFSNAWKWKVKVKSLSRIHVADSLCSTAETNATL